MDSIFRFDIWQVASFLFFACVLLFIHIGYDISFSHNTRKYCGKVTKCTTQVINVVIAAKTLEPRKRHRLLLNIPENHFTFVFL